jgi:hypothetical protein
MNHLKTVAALSIAFAFTSTLSSAQTVISSLPYTVSTAGVYVLNQTLHYPSGTGNAITITASNVILNLGGFGIINTSDQTKTSATCIFANDVENVTIENGEIFGFFHGIFLAGATSGTNFNTGQVIQNLRLAYCTIDGIFLETVSNSLIQNCQLSSIGTTGGGTVVNTNASAVLVDSAVPGGNRIYRNQVFNSPFGIVCFYSSGTNTGCYVEQNLATSCNQDGFLMQGEDAYRDNAAFNCATAFSGGNNISGNYSQ